MALTFGNKSPVAPAWRTLLGPDRVARSKYRDARYVMTIEPIHSSHHDDRARIFDSTTALHEAATDSFTCRDPFLFVRPVTSSVSKFLFAGILLIGVGPRLGHEVTSRV